MLIRRMKIQMTSYKLLMIVALGIIATKSVAQSEGNGQKTELEGDWTIVSAKSGQDSFILELAKGLTIQFSENQMTFKGKKQTTKVQFKLDASKEPKWFDLTDDKSNKAVKGIYVLDKGVLRLCVAGYPDQKRPDKFEVSPGSDYALVILEKNKD